MLLGVGYAVPTLLFRYDLFDRYLLQSFESENFSVGSFRNDFFQCCHHYSILVEIPLVSTRNGHSRCRDKTGVVQ